MRNRIPALTAKIAQATGKTEYWQAEVKVLASEKGLTAPETKAALRYLSAWSNDLETLQDALDAEFDGEEVEYHSEFVAQD
jgi:hypothetical protein